LVFGVQDAGHLPQTLINSTASVDA